MDRNVFSYQVLYLVRVALCEEGVDRNVHFLFSLLTYREVALCEEGVDRNLISQRAGDRRDVALCEEGVDRNPGGVPADHIGDAVALCEEGVDRNTSVCSAE